MQLLVLKWPYSQVPGRVHRLILLLSCGPAESLPVSTLRHSKRSLLIFNLVSLYPMTLCTNYMLKWPRWLSGEESACNAGDLGLIPGLGRPHGRGHGNPLQNSCLGNSMERGAWWVIVHGFTKNWTQLSN